jgi:hypothetical protein
VELLVGDLPIGVDPDDRCARLVLARLLRAGLLLGAAPLGRDLLQLARQAVGRSCEAVTCSSKPTTAFS